MSLKSKILESIITEKELLKHGAGDFMSIIDIARKHGVPQHEIWNQLQDGIEIEMEHTDNPEIAKEIAMDHLTERPDYYTIVQQENL
jgi:hypothetical protein